MNHCMPMPAAAGVALTHAVHALIRWHITVIKSNGSVIYETNGRSRPARAD